MKLVKLLWAFAPHLLIVCFLGSLIEGVLKLYLFATVTKKMLAPDSVQLSWLMFLMLAGVAALAHIVAQAGITYAARLAVNDLRRGLIDSVIATRLGEIEKAGSTKILTILTDDGARLVAALPGTVGLLRDTTFSVICLSYLAWVSPAMFALVCVGLLLVGCVYHPLQMSGMHWMRKIVSVSEHLFAVFRNLLDGIKQVKLNRVIERDVLAAIDASQTALTRYTLKTFVGFGSSAAIASLLLLVLLSAIAYGRFAAQLDAQSVATYAVLLIMLVGPLGAISAAMQSLSQADIALDRFMSLRRLFDSAREPASAHTEKAPAGAMLAWELLELDGLTYAHQEGDGFCVGPVCLQLRPAQVLFIVGGNGSGKTTLAKLLVGFYAPKDGQIRIDGRVVSDANRAWYRAHFATVFNDYSLFESLADCAPELVRQIDPALLRQFRLDHLLKSRDEIFSRARTFSTGERKRAALLLACLDDRPIYLFDEFAADQDPECRELFYRQIVPALSAQGKLIVVVSHDTRYFDCADTILTLERGVLPVVSHGRRASLTASCLSASSCGLA